MVATSRARGPRASWIATRTPRPAARLRLFCFAHGGGGATAFRGWADHLPTDIDVCPIQLPGRETRFHDRPLRSMRELVDSVADGVLPHLSMPYAFYGHSLGAVVAFELARRLRDSKLREPSHLVVAGHGAPHLPRIHPAISGLGDDDFIARVQALQGIPESLLANRELMDIVLPALRADYEIIEKYRHVAGEPLETPITALAGADDPIAPPEAIAAWRVHTRGAFEIEVFPGGHFFVQSSRGVVLDAIGRLLREAS